MNGTIGKENKISFLIDFFSPLKRRTFFIIDLTPTPLLRGEGSNTKSERSISYGEREIEGKVCAD
jgi:hypothetical protein